MKQLISVSKIYLFIFIQICVTKKLDFILFAVKFIPNTFCLQCSVFSDQIAYLKIYDIQRLYLLSIIIDQYCWGQYFISQPCIFFYLPSHLLTLNIPQTHLSRDTGICRYHVPGLSHLGSYDDRLLSIASSRFDAYSCFQDEENEKTSSLPWASFNFINSIIGSGVIGKKRCIFFWFPFWTSMIVQCGLLWKILWFWWLGEV